MKTKFSLVVTMLAAFTFGIIESNICVFKANEIPQYSQTESISKDYLDEIPIYKPTLNQPETSIKDSKKKVQAKPQKTSLESKLKSLIKSPFIMANCALKGIKTFILNYPIASSVGIVCASIIGLTIDHKRNEARLQRIQQASAQREQVLIQQEEELRQQEEGISQLVGLIRQQEEGIRRLAAEFIRQQEELEKWKLEFIINADNQNIEYQRTIWENDPEKWRIEAELKESVKFHFESNEQAILQSSEKTPEEKEQAKEITKIIKIKLGMYERKYLGKFYQMLSQDAPIEELQKIWEYTKLGNSCGLGKEDIDTIKQCKKLLSKKATDRHNQENIAQTLLADLTNLQKAINGQSSKPLD